MATHNKVAHAWANQTGKYRKGFAMFYDGPTIYSWGRHFPIAKHVVAPNGQPCVLFTTWSYSVSTFKHITYTRRAIPAGTIVFRVSDPERGFHAPDAIAEIHTMIQQATGLTAKAAKRRNDRYRARDLREARGWLDDAQLMVNMWQLQDAITVPELGQDLRDWLAGEEERQRQEQREVTRAARIRWRSHSWPNVKQWLRGGSLPVNHTPRPLPRIVGDTVQTTWGASVPLNAATMLYRKAVQCRRTKQGYVPSGMGLRVGDFALRQIKPNGDIVVGCHDIPFWFMRYAACKAGIEA